MKKVYEIVVGKGLANVCSCAIYRASRKMFVHAQGALMKFHNQSQYCHPEHIPVILSARSVHAGSPGDRHAKRLRGPSGEWSARSKDLSRWARRCFASLSMTRPALIVIIHNRAATFLLLACHVMLGADLCSCPGGKEAP